MNKHPAMTVIVEWESLCCSTRVNISCFQFPYWHQGSCIETTLGFASLPAFAPTCVFGKTTTLGNFSSIHTRERMSLHFVVRLDHGVFCQPTSTCMRGTHYTGTL